MADQQIKNPFMHQHEHHHHHHEDDGEAVVALDPAQQSLADALRVSFAILKVLMLVLLVVYLFSGVFWVEEHERALRLRFGAIVGDPGQQVYGPGWHLGLPYPIEQVVRVPTVQRGVRLDRTFWYELREQDVGRPRQELVARAGALNPERDGSLLTGDANILHAQFEVTYTINDPVLYVRRVGSLALAERLVRSAAERGIVHAFAQAEGDRVSRNTWPGGVAEQRAREALEQVESGIRIDTITMENPMFPLAVHDEIAGAVTAAETSRSQQIEEARQERDRLLTEVAGAAHAPLFEIIAAYELARTEGDEPAAAQYRAELDEALETLTLDEARGGAQIGGEVARVINEARTHSVTVREQIAAEASLFEAYLENHRQNPRLLKARLWQEAREQILASDQDVETFYLGRGQLYPVIRRDPELLRERQRRLQQRLDEEVTERQQQRR